MFVFNLLPILAARGIDNPYAYLVKKGFTYHTAYNLVNARTPTINLKNLAKLCVLFKCTPNDLLYFVPNAETQLEADHPLNALSKAKTHSFNISNAIKNMSLEQLNQIAELIEQSTSKKQNNKE